MENHNNNSFQSLFPKIDEIKRKLDDELYGILPQASGTNELLINASKQLWANTYNRFYSFFWFEIGSFLHKETDLIKKISLHLDLVDVLSSLLAGHYDLKLFNNNVERKAALDLLLFDGLLTLFLENLTEEFGKSGSSDREAKIFLDLILNQNWLSMAEATGPDNGSVSTNKSKHSIMLRLLHNLSEQILEAAQRDIYQQILNIITTPKSELPHSPGTEILRFEEITDDKGLLLCCQRMDSYHRWLLDHGFFM